MKCPRCGSDMIEMTNNNVKIDVCYHGCGGIWFDQFEFKKMDEVHEADEQFLEELSKTSRMPIDLEKRIYSPVVEGQLMLRRYFSTKKQVEIDECPATGGIWLDAGELTHIYATFPTEKERIAAADELFDDMFGDELAKLKEESQKDLERSRRIARALRFLCPSYYIPGKQDWGAF